MTRDFLKSQLRRISALWPLQASSEVLDEYSRILWGFTESEIAAGFDHVIDTHTEMAAPKPGHIRAAVGQVAKARRNIPPPEVEQQRQADRFTPAPDMQAIEEWVKAAGPTVGKAVEEVLDRLTASWSPDALQHRHVLYPAAMREVYEHHHRKLRVV
jgi:hypothetical protein